MRQAQDEHRSLLKDKIADGSIKAFSARTLSQLDRDGWHPGNFLMEEEFVIFCDYLKIQIVHDLHPGDEKNNKPLDFFENLSLLKGAKKDLALYDRFLSHDGKISGNKIVSRGGHVKNYAAELGIDVRTIKSMLIRGKAERNKVGAIVNGLMLRQSK